MRTSTVAAPILALLSTASARIYSIAAPSTVAVDSTVKLEITAADYIQSIQDVAISFGLQPAASAHSETLGTLLDSKFLGPDDSNVVGNISHYVHIPATAPQGDAVLTGALFSLIGAELSGSLEYFTVNITVGNSTSPNYVSSS